MLHDHIGQHDTVIFNFCIVVSRLHSTQLCDATNILINGFAIEGLPGTSPNDRKNLCTGQCNIAHNL